MTMRLVVLVSLGVVRNVQPQDLAFLLTMPCPNLCSANGWCDSGDRRCKCYEGFIGADCSLRTCPYGPAWADAPDDILVTDVGHNAAECARRGLCDRVKGTCECDVGFEGAACERRSCDLACSGQGRCVSMAHHATTKDPGVGTVFSYEANWDAEMVFGCACDAGFGGHDCSLRLCQKGDDPLTTGQVAEKQTLKCKANGGTAVIGFGGAFTEALPFSASAAAVAAAISGLRTLTKIKSRTAATVTLSAPATQWCSAAGTTTATVTFVNNFGKQSLLQVDTSLLTLTSGTPAVAVARSVTGTKESDACSNRGVCDTLTGVCECSLTSACLADCWRTSDGYGGDGTRGDCGRPTPAFQAGRDCPGEVPCSGFGQCDAATLRCSCQAGYSGADCSLMTCAKGPSWFQLPSATNVAHQTLTECSDVGVCNREMGECECALSFEGAACQYLKCAGDIPCSGHGECLSMGLLARRATIDGVSTDVTYGETPNLASTWDWDLSRGCDCNEGWSNHDCSGMACPAGDDPLSAGQDNEVQVVNCDLDAATTTAVTFTFRQGVTPPLDPRTMTLADLEAALEALDGVEDVRLALDVVGVNNGTELACAEAGRDVYVEFLRPTGDVPLIESSDELTFSISEYMQGTKEHDECSGRGLCDTFTGVCNCFPGYGSSDSQGARGPWADCGFVLPAVEELQDRVPRNE